MSLNDSNPEPDIKPGDVVYLKSGSPPLTVEAKDAQGCTVAWFDGAHPFGIRFDPAALTKVNPTQLNAAQAQLDAAYAQHNEDLKRMDELQTARDVLAGRAARYEEEISKLDREIDVLKSDVAVLDAENQELKLKNEALTPQWKLIKEELPPMNMLVLAVYVTQPNEIGIFFRVKNHFCTGIHRWARIPAAWMP